MRILMLTDNFPPMLGGIAEFLVNICRQLVAHDHHVEVFFWGQELDNSPRFEFPVRRFNIKPGNKASSIRCALSIAQACLAKRRTIDLVFLGHLTSLQGFGALLLNRLAGKPLVILCHGNDAMYYLSHSMKDRIIARWLLTRGNLILTNSNATRAQLVTDGVSSSRIRVFSPGVDTRLFRPGPPSPSIMEKYGLQGKKVILTVGRLVKNKNHASVIRALASIHGDTNDVVYLIPSDGEEKPNLESLARELGIEKRVIFIGHISPNELLLLYRSSYIFALPSIAEGFGIAVLEAMACGLPVVVSNYGGPLDYVENGRTGFMVNPTDVGSIAKALHQLLTDKEQAWAMGLAGRAAAEGRFDWSKRGEELNHILEGMIIGR